MSDLRYPIGRFHYERPLGVNERRTVIEEIVRAPQALRTAVSGLNASQLDRPYRPGGWTVRQVVHHVPDSHMNAYIRFKLALTEEAPSIRPYDENGWAALADVHAVPLATPLRLLEALHERWVGLLRVLTDGDWCRAFVHPESGSAVTLDEAVASYAWHGRHHVAHITALRDREGW